MSGSKVENFNCSKESSLDIPVQILLQLSGHSDMFQEKKKKKLVNNGHERRNSKISHCIFLGVLCLGGKDHLKTST